VRELKEMREEQEDGGVRRLIWLLTTDKGEK
jgi:hypothetical protein